MQKLDLKNKLKQFEGALSPFLLLKNYNINGDMYMTKEDFANIIYGFAVGDALGVPYEFSAHKIKEIKKLKYKSGGTHLQAKGVYSDDTALMLATMDTMPSMQYKKNCGFLNYEVLFNAFKNWLEKGSYSATGYVFDVGYSTNLALKGEYKNKQIGDNNYEGNGSLTRIIPFAIFSLYKTFEEKKDIIFKASSVTHSSKIACWCCLIYSEFLILLLKYPDKTKEEVFKILHDELIKEAPKEYSYLFSLELKEAKEEMIRPSGHVPETLKTVFWLFLNYDSYENALRKTIQLGNDTDTIGALIGALIATKYSETLSKKLVKKLRNKDLIDKMINKFWSFFISTL